VDPRITFFPKRKVRVELSDWAKKRNSQDEKRVRLDFTIPLLDDAREGVLPSWLMSPLASFESKDSVESKTKLEVELDGVSMELWDTPKSPGRSQLFAAAQLSDFYLVRETRDGSTVLSLIFTTNVKRTFDVLKWCDRYESSYMWVEFTPADPATATPPTPGVQMTIADVKSSAANDVVQTPEEAQANAENFLKKEQEEVAAQPIEEQEAELATVGKPEKLKRPRGFSPKGAA
jgi:hypothetical protein